MSRILVVDDDNDHRFFVMTLIERLGHEAIPASNGDECLEILKTEKADLLIIDIFMPGKDGIEVVSDLGEQGSDIPVIGMTGGYRGVVKPYAHILEVLAGGTVLRKPFGLDKMRAALAEVFEAGGKTTPC